MTQTSNNMTLNQFLTTYRKPFKSTAHKDFVIGLHKERLEKTGKTWVEPHNSITGEKVFYYDDSHIKNR
jgi:hypothetical protein